jgi:LacI family transcriptional regulator
MGEGGRARIEAVTIKQVAARAGVHPSTVSRALNPATRVKVAADKAALVAAAAAELGYRPDFRAASLRTGRSRHIGVLLPDIQNSVFAPILAGATERLAAEGYAVMVADAGRRPESQLAMLDEMIAHRVDGLILATAQLDDPGVTRCLERDAPVVLVNRSEGRSRVSAVVSDDALGAQLATEHLIRLGHRAIGYLGGPEHQSTGSLRRSGFEAAMALHGLTPLAGSIVTTDAYSREDGRRGADRLLQRTPGLTAVVAANDLLALGVYDALGLAGLTCPTDVSVVGHNDMPLMDLVSPPLTTVRIDHRNMGREAADLLLMSIRRQDTQMRTVVLRPELIVRASTAPRA